MFLRCCFPTPEHRTDRGGNSLSATTGGSPKPPSRTGQKSRLACLAAALALFFFLPVLATFAADDNRMNRQLSRTEKFVYGKPVSGALTERLNKLEQDLLGRESAAAPVQKAENLTNFLFRGDRRSPSLDLKVKYLEWLTFHEVRRGPLADRLAALDKAVIGKATREPLAFRVEQLIQLVVTGGFITMTPVKIRKDTVLRVRVGSTISSKDAQVGDEVPLTVLEDLVLDRNVLAIPRGSSAIGDLDQARPAGRFGRPGRMRFLVREAEAIDGTSLPALLKEVAMSDADKKKLGLAAGASVVGYLALGPVGLVGGIFVKGKEAVLPEGTELLISITEDVPVHGIVINRK